MTTAELITHQTRDAYAWLHKMVADIPYEQWDTLPDGIGSTISWQVGHMILSHYFHTL